MNLDDLSITPKKMAVPCFTYSASGQRETSLFIFSPLGSRARARPEGHLNRTFGARARANPTPKKSSKFGHSLSQFTWHNLAPIK